MKWRTEIYHWDIRYIFPLAYVCIYLHIYVELTYSEVELEDLNKKVETKDIVTIG